MRIPLPVHYSISNLICNAMNFAIYYKFNLPTNCELWRVMQAQYFSSVTVLKQFQTDIFSIYINSQSLKLSEVTLKSSGTLICRMNMHVYMCITDQVPMHTIMFFLNVSGCQWGNWHIVLSIGGGVRVERGRGGSAEYKAPSGRNWHRWSHRPTEQHSMSAALLKKAPGIHGGLWQTWALCFSQQLV